MYPDGLQSGYGTADVQVFPGWATVTNTQWRTWRKPAGKTMAFMLCIGGAGGGGGGFGAAAAAARGGGGGGGSSAVTRVLMPLLLLPDTLFIQAGAGGVGQVSGGGVAGSGILSYIAIAPDITATNVFAVSGAAAAVGGGTGTGAAVGAAGTAGTIAAITAMPLAGIGQYAFIAGQAGAAGGAVAGAIGPPTSIATTGCMTQGGGGGAGTTSADFAGSIVTAITGSLLSQMAPIGAAAGSNAGSGGYMLKNPFFFSYAGLGGGSSNTANGGNGGKGAFGSGGGGGGGGTAGAGRGGDGGAGLIVIVSW